VKHGYTLPWRRTDTVKGRLNSFEAINNKVMNIVDSSGFTDYLTGRKKKDKKGYFKIG
jgi:hypothetical protein